MKTFFCRSCNVAAWRKFRASRKPSCSPAAVNKTRHRFCLAGVCGRFSRDAELTAADRGVGTGRVRFFADEMDCFYG